MNQIKKYETHGRKLMVEFKCYRCKKTETRPFEDCVKEKRDGYDDLYDLNPPKDWRNGGFYYPTFCPQCAREYDLFMKGGDSDA